MIEDAGKAVSDTVAAFKGSPSCLAAILLAAIFAFLTFYALQRDADRRAHTVDLLLSKCVPNVDEDIKP